VQGKNLNHIIMYITLWKGTYIRSMKESYHWGIKHKIKQGLWMANVLTTIGTSVVCSIPWLVAGSAQPNRSQHLVVDAICFMVCEIGASNQGLIDLAKHILGGYGSRVGWKMEGAWIFTALM
jgi:hypothetical protein